MSDFLAAEGIPTLERLPAPSTSPATSTSSSSATRSRAAIAELEEVLDRKIRYCSLPEAIREHFLWGARSIVIAGTHGKTTTTSLTGWLLTHGGARSERPRRRHRAQLRRARLELPPRAGARLRHRRRRVRQRVLRQDREVPEVPAGHRRRQQRRVRPRRHLRRPRRGDAGVPPAGQPRAATRPAAARRGQPGALRAGRRARESRVETFGTGDGRRLAGARPRAARRDRRAFSVRRHGVAVRRRSRCRCSARTTSATRWRRSPSAHRGRDRRRADRRRAAALRRRQAPARGRRRRPTASRSTTTSRTIRPRSPRRWRACAPSNPGAAHLGGLRAALGLVVPARLPGRLRARVRRRRRGADRAGLPLDAAGGGAAVGAAARSRSRTSAASRRARPRRSTTSSRRSSASIGPAISSC